MRKHSARRCCEDRPNSTMGQATMAQAHPVERLRAWQHANVTAYPEGSVPVPAPLEATAFFTAGPGLWMGERGELDLPPLPVGGVMFVGDALGSEKGYRAWVAAQGAVTVMPTWKGLRRLLSEVGLEWRECFFTNVYLGLIAGDHNAVRHPASRHRKRHASFRDTCRRFLELQIATMRPRAVVVLGQQPLEFFAEHGPGLEDWRGRRISQLGNSRDAIRILRTGEHEATAVPILHPANYHKTGMLTRWRGHAGIDTEVQLVRNALIAADEPRSGSR